MRFSGKIIQGKRNAGKLGQLRSECVQIKCWLEDLLAKGKIDEYTKCTIIDMSNRVLDSIAQKCEPVREGVRSVLGGKILEYEAKPIRNEGLREGRDEGLREGMRMLVDSLRSLSIEDEAILSQLIQRYQLTREEADALLK